MIFDAQSYSFIFQDAVYSLAIGFVTGFFNQLLAVFLYKGKTKVFIRDVAVSLLFTVLIFSYSVSFANYKILRWYNVLLALVGRRLFTPCFSTAGNVLLKLAGIAVKHSARNTVKKAGAKMQLIRQKNIEKKQKFTQKNTPEVLQREDVLLYN